MLNYLQFRFRLIFWVIFFKLMVFKNFSYLSVQQREFPSRASVFSFMLSTFSFQASDGISWIAYTEVYVEG